MKKILAFVFTFVLLCGVLTACTGSSNSNSSSDEKKTEKPASTQKKDEKSKPTQNPDGTYTMRIGHAQTEESPRHRSLETFKAAVEEKTDGKVKVEIYPNGELGNETEMTADVSAGDLEAVRGGDLDFVPKSTILGLPMIADDKEEVRKLCSSDYVLNMLSTAETEHNMKVLAVGDDSGFRQITNNVRPITKPADMKGLKMRAPLEVVALSMEEFGASAVSIPFTELYAALADGSVDGQENPLALIDSSKFYEVQKYCTVIDYMFFAELMYVNLDWWNSLPEEYQTIITDCANDMMEECSRITDEENELYLQHISENGCEIYTLSDEEREAFKPLAENVWQKYVDNGYISKEELDEMLAVIGKSVDW